MSERVVTNKDKRRSLDWNTVPWLAAHRIGGHHPRMIHRAEQARHHSAHTSPIEEEQIPKEGALDASVMPAENRGPTIPPTD